MSIQRVLLICGALGALLYLAADIVAAAFVYPGYDYTAQQVSELSAIGAPSRPFWMAMGYPYGLLVIAFATGIWMAAGTRPALRIAAVVIALFAVNGFAWGLLAPMHMRATEFTTTDTLHIAFAAAAILLIMTFIGFGAAALDNAFRLYSAATLIVMLAAGFVVSTQVTAIASGQPTPWMGLVERVSVYLPMIWLIAFADRLLRRDAAINHKP